MLDHREPAGLGTRAGSESRGGAARDIAEVRAGVATGAGRAALGRLVFRSRSPPAWSRTSRPADGLVFEETGFGKDVRLKMGPGFVVLDGELGPTIGASFTRRSASIEERLHVSEFHPDVWQPANRPQSGRYACAARRRRRRQYSYRQLDEFTDLLQKTNAGRCPATSKVQRAGVPEASASISTTRNNGSRPTVCTPRRCAAVRDAQQRLSGGILEVGSKNITIDPSGELTNGARHRRDDGAARPGGCCRRICATSSTSAATTRSRRSSRTTLRSPTGPRDGPVGAVRARSNTSRIQMRAGEQIRDFGQAIARCSRACGRRLPPDLIIARTSDSPSRSAEIIERLHEQPLRGRSCWWSSVALIGFWEWRSALLMALSIPLTLAMTAGFMSVLGLDLQQISIGGRLSSRSACWWTTRSWPTTRNQREMANGQPRRIAMPGSGRRKIGRADPVRDDHEHRRLCTAAPADCDLGRFIYAIPWSSRRRWCARGSCR